MLRRLKSSAMNGPITHRCDRRLQRLQNFFCKRVYYYVNVYLNENHMSETKQNYDGKPSYSALRSITAQLTTHIGPLTGQRWYLLAHSGYWQHVRRRHRPLEYCE